MRQELSRALESPSMAPRRIASTNATHPLAVSLDSQGEFVFSPASLTVYPGDIVAVQPSGFSGTVNASGSTFSPGGSIPLTSGQLQNLMVIADPANSGLEFMSSTGADGSAPVVVPIPVTITLSPNGNIAFAPSGLEVVAGDKVDVMTAANVSGTLHASCSTFFPCGSIPMSPSKKLLLTVISNPSDSHLGFTDSNNATGDIPVSTGVGIPPGVPNS